ncbi:hypothetical protein PR048_017362 [Dryococelus australis]|uniref:Uncharacterized protein n=1 Tax=Dryococelus australis TaxID=614101 RepID=A0ABQ9H9C4_9NEOP|nr:hypothetical protein PR048_017362 [Dryococelus australis]
MYITKLENLLPINVDTEVLFGEWKLLQVEGEISQLKEDQSIDRYWRQFFSNYPSVATQVKACLSLSYGTRFFFIWPFTGRSCYNEFKNTLNAKLTILSCKKKYCNKPELVPITFEILKQARNAGHNHKTYLEKERKS